MLLIALALGWLNFAGPETAAYDAQVRRWIADIVVGRKQGVPVRTYVQPESLATRVKLVPTEVNQPFFDFDENCFCFSLTEVAFVIGAGYDVIPDLLELVDNVNQTPWFYHHPASSKLVNDGRLVGEIACYLIEAILRENPYFSWTANLQRKAKVGDPDASDRLLALKEAGAAYKEWYKTACKREAGGVICDMRNLPKVAWELTIDPKWSPVKRVGK